MGAQKEFFHNKDSKDPKTDSLLNASKAFLLSSRRLAKADPFAAVPSPLAAALLLSGPLLGFDCFR